MNYFNLVKNIQDTALKHQFVQEFFEGDVYEIMNTKDRKYPTVILTTERIGDTNGYQTITASLFCIDRLTSDGVNKLEVQSICQTILQGILLKLESTYPEMTIQTESFVPFTEKFKDLCAGMYVECSLSYPSVICDDEVFTTKEIILKSNGIYDVIGYDRAIVSVETPTQSKELSISANGSYTVLPDEGYYLDELKLDVDVAPDLDFKYITDVKLNITDNIALPEVYYSLFNDAQTVKFGGNVNSIEFKEGNLTQVKSISSVFYECKSLTSITFPNGALTQISSMGYAFYNCSSLTSIIFPEGSLAQVKTINDTFQNCSSLTSIVFPEGSLRLVSTMSWTFEHCPRLTSVIFPEGALTQVTDMVWTFYGCSSLASVIIPNGALTQVKNMYWTFKDCLSLASITFPEGALTQVLSMYYTFHTCNSLTSITFPDGALTQVTTVESAFFACSSLTSITFPEGALTQLKSISNTFIYCRNLTSITFPEGTLTQVTTMSYTFAGCSKLQDLTIYNLPNINLYNIGFSSCTSLTLQSLQNIINALPVTTSGYKCTIGTTNLNKLSDADIQIATDKGWILN